MYSKKLSKPNQATTAATPSTSTWSSSMSRTLASALIPNSKSSKDRRVDRPGPVPYEYPEPPSSPRSSPSRKSIAVSRVDEPDRNVYGISKSRSEGEYYNERYYQVGQSLMLHPSGALTWSILLFNYSQAQIAHLQTALVREHGLFVHFVSSMNLEADTI